eukprot:scaffold43133_cov19-Tisochrysis_lutea.AAC.1
MNFNTVCLLGCTCLLVAVQDHLEGKQYLGWKAIRERYAELLAKYGAGKAARRCVLIRRARKYLSRLCRCWGDVALSVRQKFREKCYDSITSLNFAQVAHWEPDKRHASLQQWNVVACADPSAGS